MKSGGLFELALRLFELVLGLFELALALFEVFLDGVLFKILNR